MTKTKSITQALVVMALWGLLFPLVKLGYLSCGIETTGDILLFAGVRFTVCGGVICIFCALRKRSEFRSLRNVVFPVLLSGFFAIVLHYGLNYCGLMLTDSSKTAILKQAGSVIYVFCAPLFFRGDTLTVKKIIGVLLGLSGIIAINISGGGISVGIGDVMIIAASVCMMISNIISKRAFASASPIVATGVSQLFGGILLLATGAACGGSMELASVSGAPIMLAIIAASVISYCLWYISVARGNLSNLFIIKFAEPVFASIFGALLLGENILRPQYAAAFLLITAGIYISNK